METTITTASIIVDLAISVYLFYNVGIMVNGRFTRSDIHDSKYGLAVSLFVNLYLLFVLLVDTDFFLSLIGGYFIGGYLSQVTNPKSKLLGYKYQQMNRVVYIVVSEIYIELYQFFNKRK